jgi:hypothetical protein
MIIANDMTTMICPPAPSIPSFNPGAHLRAGLSRLRAHLHSAMLVVVLLLAASISALADEVLQDWIPGALEMPADIEVITDRAIGSSIRMFSFSTERDGEELLSEWEAALTEEQGYQITRTQDEVLGNAIEFSGDDILNAKILVAPQSDGNETVIEFDATLR